MPFKSTTETMKKLHLDYKRETGNQAKSDAGDVEFGSEKAGRFQDIKIPKYLIEVADMPLELNFTNQVIEFYTISYIKWLEEKVEQLSERKA
jgi:hypothetical protein